MHPFIFSLVAVVLSAVGIRAGPSGAPTCTWHCPYQDKMHYLIGVHSDTGGSLFCSYPGGDTNPADFYCTYSDSTGALTYDHDGGECPATAAQFCSRRRKRQSIVEYLRHRRDAAPAPPATSRPDAMKNRAEMARKKRLADEAAAAAAAA